MAPFLVAWTAVGPRTDIWLSLLSRIAVQGRRARQEPRPGIRGALRSRGASLGWFASLVAMAALAAPASAQPPADCSLGAQNIFVRNVLFDYYLWYRELVPFNPVRFPSPETYLETVRYRPLDAAFSYIAPRREQEALFSASEYVGLGFSTLVEGAALRVSQTFPQSPAADAGLARGDRIVTINGRPVAELLSTGTVSEAFGPPAEGVAVDVVWQPITGAERRARLVKRIVVIPTVGTTRLFDVDGRRVGYVVFRNFVRPSVAALDAAFASLAKGGASELVVDLRYNGGGLLEVAEHLASLIGGRRTAGQVFAELVHNDRHTALNVTRRFASPPHALDLSRLAVITTRASASASELVINALRPFMPVQIVGAPTYGKPVGQYGFPFCDKIFNPVSFVVRNANGQADYFGGFPADCPARDDLDRELGDPAEASLAEALYWIRTGSCSVPRRLALAAPPASRSAEADGWQRLVGAR